MGLFNDNIDYESYARSVIDENNKQVDTGIVIADKTNYNYIFESQTPIDSVLNQLPGYVIKVTYFNKSPGNAEVYEFPDFTIDDLIVEYTRIDNMSLYLESPIEATELKNYEGAGYIKSRIEPQPGDFFLAKLYDGRLGLFVVTATDAVTYNFSRIFKVNFKFYLFPSDKDLEKINKNTALELIADDKLNTSREEILYEKSRYITIREVIRKENEILEIWKRKFITQENNYNLGYRDELGLLIVDPYLEKYVTSLIGITNMKNITLTNMDVKERSIFDIILDREQITYGIKKHYTTKPAIDTFFTPFLKSYAYNQMDKIVILTDDKNDPYYVFSETLYNNLIVKNDDEEILFDSAVELGVFSIINDINIDLDTLETILDEVDEIIRNNDEYEMYYKIPVTINILKYYKFKNNYTNHFLF